MIDVEICVMDDEVCVNELWYEGADDLYDVLDNLYTDWTADTQHSAAEVGDWSAAADWSRDWIDVAYKGRVRFSLTQDTMQALCEMIEEDQAWREGEYADD